MVKQPRAQFDVDTIRRVREEIGAKDAENSLEDRRRRASR